VDSPAVGGTMVGMSDNEPVAWVVFADDGSDAVTVCLNRDVAGVIAEAHGWQVAPLYRSPFFTDQELDAIRESAGRFIAECDEHLARGLDATEMEPTRDTLIALLRRICP
jgi:hypothetical protein